MTHTEGPWELGSYSLRGESYTAIDGVGWDELATVVTRMKGSDENNPEGMANAWLIAAAPDLLAALEALHACHRAFSGNDNWTMLDDEARALAENAIAKAKGQ
jgi:hypothetical protein